MCWLYEKYNIQGAVGVIDCPHVAIIPSKAEDPTYPEHVYVIRKGYHLINTQSVCIIYF